MKISTQVAEDPHDRAADVLGDGTWLGLRAGVALKGLSDGTNSANQAGSKGVSLASGRKTK
ncbi:hypothetical protein WD218_005105 [Klebsiella variicola]